MNEKIYNLSELKGADWQSTVRHVNAAKTVCSIANFKFVVVIDSKSLSEFQLMHMRHGIVPFSQSVMNIPDKVIFIDDGVEKVIKDRYEVI